MTISPASTLAAAHQPQETPSQASGKPKSSSQQSADTVHLSPEASAKLKSGDVDGDGDSH